MKERFPPYTLAVFFLVTVFIWSYAFSKTGSGNLTVTFLDIGQGDAIFIETPSGKQMLIDGGPGKSVLRELRGVMPFFDRTIDIVIATHPDKDHIGGLPDVFERYEVVQFFEPGVSADTGAYHTLQDLVEAEGAARLLARRGMVIDFGDGVVFEILFPDRDVSGLETNAGSVIGQLIYGETEFLLSGDAPTAIEAYVVSLDGERLKSDVLKAGHHGSNTSNSEIFVAAASPQFGVISSAEGNRYGHPHQEVLDTFTQFDIEVLSTAESGSITFISDGATLRIE